MSQRRALAIAAGLVALAGCATPGVGLLPAHRPAPGESPRLAGPDRYASWWIGQYDSLQPELEWEAFPRASDPPTLRQRVTDVTYDLRVWRALPSDQPNTLVLVDLVYSRDGLTAPGHRLEQPLLPSTNHVWTVRARYRTDGMPRATEWSGLGPQARLPIEPNPWRYRFLTPAR